MDVKISFDAKRLALDLKQFSAKQLPYAVTLALRSVAKSGIKSEQEAMKKQLDRPNAFTLRGPEIAIAPTKTKWQVTLAIKELQARYLAPEIEGGKQVFGNSKAILKPVNVGLNQFGNIPAAMLNRLKQRPDVFVGTVEFHDGQKISGVWQMPPALASNGRVTRKTTGGGKMSQAGLTGGHRTGWKLLIRFSDPVAVKTRYSWGDAIVATAKRSFFGELNAAMTKAIVTAR